jgi:hypothetical protein
MAYASIAHLRQYLDQVPTYGSQRMSLTGNPTGGTFTLGYAGATSAAIAYNASAASVATILGVVAGLGTGVSVGGPAGGPWLVTFSSGVAAQASALTLATNSLTGGTAPSVQIEPATDDLLQVCLDRASGMIDEVLGFSFLSAGESTPAPSARIVQAEPYTSRTLLLPPLTPPITSVNRLVGLGTTSEMTEAITGYTLLPDGRTLYLERMWEAEAFYQITAAWTYGPAPETIVQLCLELAVNIWRGRDRGLWAEVLGASDGGTLRYLGGLNATQRTLIRAVRRRFVEIAL